MNNIIQIEREHCEKFCGEKNIISWFNKKLPWKKGKPETTRITARPSPPLFSFQKQPPTKKLFSKVAVLKFRKIPFETPAVGFCFNCRA